MNSLSYTPDALDVIKYSKEEAHRLGSSSINPEHIVLGIMRAYECNAARILLKIPANYQEMRKQLDVSAIFRSEDSVLSPDYKPVDIKDLYFNEKMQQILRLCMQEARIDNLDAMGSEHLLLGILKDNDNNASAIMGKYNITYNLVRTKMSAMNLTQETKMGFTEDEDEEYDDGITRKEGSDNFPSKRGGEKVSQAKSSKSDNGGNKFVLLTKFGTDLTKAAKEGKLDKVVGREKEIERIAQILCRRKKNNPVLIGEPGVGKSAIVEGLAMRIAEKKVSRMLFDKTIIMLDLTSLVAGTKYRGEFEERILGVINEAKENPNVILFIDEIHTLVGAGSAAGSMDAANILKPALARGELQCIGATTLKEYRESVEKDGALERRFQKVIVEPTSREETLSILSNIKEQYEEFHNVTYTDEAIKACVDLTERYISDRSFPDKAIDAMDEAGSRVHIGNVTVPESIENQEKQIEEVKEKKNEAIKLQNYEMAAGLRDKEKELQAELEAMKEEWQNKQKENRLLIDREQIEEVVSMMSGVPAQRIGDSENSKLKNMRTNLQNKVIGQDNAVDALVKAIKRSRTGLKDPNKPIGTFLFTGPTGVGKTLLAKALAEELFGTKDSLIRIDMSEYMDKYTVSRMVGAPPGYIGYDEGGQLTEKVRRKPYSIVLMDEIEKAHPDVFNFLLQIMDEGRLTDNTGRTVDFKNTVIIMTSNVGSRQVKDFGKGIGFNAVMKQDDPEYANSIVKKALEKTFAPEFINRLDEIISFRQLDMDALLKITDIELEGLFRRIGNMGYKISITNEAKELIAKKGSDIQYGARPLKRAIQNNIEDKLAEMLVDIEPAQGASIVIGTTDDGKETDIKID